MTKINDLPTPTVIADSGRVAKNIRAMQAACDAYGVELRPHVKTHKMVAVGRLQLEAGARGFTCAKLGEAEAMLPSGVKRIFIAHSLVDPRQAPRLAALAERLEELSVAVTSAEQAEALARLAQLAGLRLRVKMAVDTGLGREGIRSLPEAQALALQIARSANLKLRGFYTHEGQLYSASPAEQADQCERVITRLAAVRDAIDAELPIWPGCSVSARLMAASGRVQAVRPGAYVFGDLALTQVSGVMAMTDAAVHVLATVVDRPEPGLALIDAGSKTLSGDRTPEKVHAVPADGRDFAVVRVNEEHGYVRGEGVDSLKVGDRLRLVPAHVCPVINLTDEVTVVAGDDVIDTWRVEARGCVR
jgi:D-serine deaminase-like pyridoxal phosphate-dependent protein